MRAGPNKYSRKYLSSFLISFFKLFTGHHHVTLRHAERENQHLFWPYHVFPYFQPIRTIVISNNQEAPYSEPSRASKNPHHHMTRSSNRHFASDCHCLHFKLRSSPPSCRQNTLLCNKTNIYGGTTLQNVWKTQNFEIQKFLGPRFQGCFWALGALALLFETLLWLAS